MNDLDSLLVQLNQPRKPLVENVTSLQIKKQIPWMNIILIISVLGLGGYIILDKRDKADPVPPTPTPIVVTDVAKIVETQENAYSAAKAICYTKIIELLDQGKLENQEDLKSNTRNLLEEAREQTLGVIDKLDEENIPLDFEKDKLVLRNYLLKKIKGFEEASK